MEIWKDLEKALGEVGLSTAQRKNLAHRKEMALTPSGVKKNSGQATGRTATATMCLAELPMTYKWHYQPYTAVTNLIKS